eukprot:385599_1
MFYRSRNQIQLRSTVSQTKFKRISRAIFFFCVQFKVTCSIWMLIVFALFVIYLNDNYMNPVISLPHTNVLSSTAPTLPYLNPNTFRSLYGNCPFTNPTYPSIGPDIPYICPSQKPYRIGSVWYLERDILEYRSAKDGDIDIKRFFETYENIKSIILNYTDHGAFIKRLKSTDSLHLAYLYTSCQTKQDITTIHNKWPDMIDSDHYDDIFNQYGFNSWTDATICFDRVLCMNNDNSGQISFNLYLDSMSQKMMQQLAAKTEEIQTTKHDIELTFQRVEQQSFHVTLGSVLNTEDFGSFDANKLMNIVNEKTLGQFPCIRLTQPPAIAAKMCKNTKNLQKSIPRFDWHCVEI